MTGVIDILTKEQIEALKKVFQIKGGRVIIHIDHDGNIRRVEIEKVVFWK